MSLNVLVIDDSATMRRMIGRALQMTGLPIGRIEEAGDGAAGLSALRARPFDLALVDINMPHMDGLSMIDAASRDTQVSSVPMVVVSTEASEARLAELERRGIPLVRKPFDPERLLDAVLGAIGGVR
jgi:two-component system, chemotaxis family, chemotaxis protein CheY